MFGPYNIDTTPPTISQFDISSTTNNYNKKVKLTINGSDNITKTENLEICISKSNSCIAYSKFSTNKEFDLGGNYDGSEKTIYIFMKYEAGNINKTSKKYKVYKECQDTNLELSGTWTRVGFCSKKCGTGVQKYKASSKDKNNGASCSKELEKTESCKEHDCCAEVKYINGTNCVGTCGSGTYNQLAYDKYDTTYACSDKNKASGGSVCTLPACKYKLTYNDNGGSGCSTKSTEQESGKAWGTLCEPTKSGSTFAGWYNGSTKVTSNSIASNNVTVNAKWKQLTFTLVLELNGGVSRNDCPITDTTQTKNIEEDIEICSPKNDTLVFGGWTSSTENAKYGITQAKAKFCSNCHSGSQPYKKSMFRYTGEPNETVTLTATWRVPNFYSTNPSPITGNNGITNGEPDIYGNLSTAIKNSDPGATIIMLQSTNHRENITVDRNITIQTTGKRVLVGKLYYRKAENFKYTNNQGALTIDAKKTLTVLGDGELIFNSVTNNGTLNAKVTKKNGVYHVTKK